MKILYVFLVLLISYECIAQPITYGITVSTESSELNRLLKQLNDNFESDDKILVQVDKDSYTTEVINVIEKYKKIIPENQFKVIFFPLNKDFSAFKNNLLKNAGSSGYIFQIDADEVLSFSLMQNLKYYLDQNNDADMIYVPRANYYINTDEDKEFEKNYKAHSDDLGRFNYPDTQGRIIKLSNKNIAFVGKIHERVEGAQRVISMPQNKSQSYDLIHIKTLKKQKRSDDFYHKNF